MNNPFKEILKTLYDGTLEDLAEIAYRILKNPVLVLNASYRILACSRSSDACSDFFKRHQYGNYLDEATIARLKRHKIMTRLGDERKAFIHEGFPDISQMVCAPVIINRILAGMVFVPDLLHPLGDDAVDFCDYLARAVSVELQKTNDYILQNDSMNESFFDDLLEQRQKDTAEIETCLKMLNLTVKEQKAVVAVTFKEKGLSDRMFATLQKALSDNCHSPLTIFKDHTIIMLISENTLEEIAGQRKSLAEFCQYRKVNAGISRVFTDISQTALYYKQAVGILNLADYLCMDRNVYDFEDFLTYHLLYHCMENDIPLDDYVSRDILALQAYDLKHDTELSKTLHTYMLNMGNAVATVKELNIHRNTFYYRLGKIQELIQSDLSNGDTCFRYILGYKILDYKKYRDIHK